MTLTSAVGLVWSVNRIVEADGLADAHVELGREPARDGLRRDAPRLRVADHAFDAAAGLEAELRQLRRLAAARVAADDDDAMRLDRREQLLARRRDRQRLRILEPIARRSPRGDDLLARAAHSRPPYSLLSHPSYLLTQPYLRTAALVPRTIPVRSSQQPRNTCRTSSAILNVPYVHTDGDTLFCIPSSNSTTHISLSASTRIAPTLDFPSFISSTLALPS